MTATGLVEPGRARGMHGEPASESPAAARDRGRHHLRVRVLGSLRPRGHGRLVRPGRRARAPARAAGRLGAAHGARLRRARLGDPRGGRLLRLGQARPRRVLGLPVRLVVVAHHVRRLGALHRAGHRLPAVLAGPGPHRGLADGGGHHRRARLPQHPRPQRDRRQLHRHGRHHHGAVRGTDHPRVRELARCALAAVRVPRAERADEHRVRPRRRHVDVLGLRLDVGAGGRGGAAAARDPQGAHDRDAAHRGLVLRADAGRAGRRRPLGRVDHGGRHQLRRDRRTARRDGAREWPCWSPPW